jgi:hypothetical protein
VHGDGARDSSDADARRPRHSCRCRSEVLARLANHGVALDSTAATRILQLYPTAPLRQLATGTRAGTGP